MRAWLLALALAQGCATVEPERILRLHPAVGATQRVAVSTYLERRAGADPPPPIRVQVTFTATVSEVAAPGGIRYTLDGVELALPGDPKLLTPELVAKLAARMSWAAEVRGSGSVSDRGSQQAFELPLPSEDPDPVTATLEKVVASAMAALAAELTLIGIPLPDGAVAPRATWTGSRTATLDGIAVRADAQYTLLECDGRRARVKVAAELAGDGTKGGFDGELAYDLEKPFPVAARLQYRLETRTPEGSVKHDYQLIIEAP